MAITTSGTTLTFNDATTQTTAPVNTSANVTSATAVAGTGISVTAVTTTGAATHTVTNTGVTSAVAGRGISVSGSTGAVTVSAAAGSVLQVVSTTKTDSFSTTNTSFTDVTSLSATITPTSATSKILVQVVLGAVAASDGTIVYSQLLRGSTAIAAGAGAAGVLNQQYGGSTGTGSGYYGNLPAMAIVLDSPATTSATTYKVQLAGYGGNTAYLNRSAYDSAPYNGRTISSITLMEISA